MNALMGYLSEVLRRGFEGDDFILGLCEHFRNLLFAKNIDTLRLMEVSDTVKKRYLEQTNMATNSFLNQLSLSRQSMRCQLQAV
jgi:DNA polymerase-3 subunit gamma/tau